MLKPEDLKDTILPLISIDEFEPKSGTTKEILVIGLHAIDENPAKDLNTFIQRGNFEFLDTEVSPNPNEKGEWLIFIEFPRNIEFKEGFFKFIKDIENVTGKNEWQVKPYLADHAYDLHDEAWQGYVMLEPEKYITKDAYTKIQNVKDSFKESRINDLTMSEGYIIMSGANTKIAGKFIDFGKFDSVFADNSLYESAVELNQPAEVRALEAILGPNWTVNKIGDKVAVENSHNEMLLLGDLQFSY